MKLHLGFERFTYATRYQAASPLSLAAKAKRPHRMTKSQRSYGQGKTTLDVAQELEERYHILENFVELESDLFSKLFEDAFIEATEDVEKYTRRATLQTRDTEKIESRFRANLSRRRYDGVIPGVPTIASLRGVSHLRSKPYAKRGSRPSFIDTGMYQKSFRAWLTEGNE